MKKPPPKVPSAELHFRLPAEHYDDVYAAAQEKRLTVPEWVRQAIRKQVLRQNLDDD
jgi:predicted HicB family RNase H-like nuclease